MRYVYALATPDGKLFHVQAAATNFARSPITPPGTKTVPYITESERVRHAASVKEDPLVHSVESGIKIEQNSNSSNFSRSP